MQLAEEEIPLGPLVIGRARAVRRQARVGQCLQSDGGDVTRDGVEGDLVGVLLGGVAGSEDRTKPGEPVLRQLILLRSSEGQEAVFGRENDGVAHDDRRR